LSDKSVSYLLPLSSEREDDPRFELEPLELLKLLLELLEERDEEELEEDDRRGDAGRDDALGAFDWLPLLPFCLALVGAWFGRE